MPDNVILAIVIGGSIVMGLLVVVGIPVTLGLRHAARQRELEHLERLKALELGRPLPGEAHAGDGDASSGTGDGTHWSASIGLWVPLGALGIALAATNQSSAHDVAVWLAAGAVGVTALICATVLALRAPAATVPSAPATATNKVVTEADEFDVVGRRG